MQQQALPAKPARPYTNTALTVIAVLLGIIALNLSGLPRTADAQVGIVGGRPSEPAADGLISAGEQRKMIHAELKTLNEKMDRLQAMLEKGVNVRVLAMPASDRAADKPAEAPKQ